MRPVVKKKPGEQITYFTSNNKKVTETIKETYSPYQKAKLPLMANIGAYCSYCESAKVSSDVAVEHIEPKGTNGDSTAWNNFVLGCTICNSIKGHSVILPNDYHWPHTDNTFRDFIYKASGCVVLNPNLDDEEKVKAKRLFDLVKLGAYPGNEEQQPTPMDYRWQKRLEVWCEADRLLGKLKKSTADVDEVIRMAKLLGCWSVWFTVFEENDEVRRRLITDFPGTCQSCFDAANHYEPIKRA